jgi:hypothetical protein
MISILPRPASPPLSNHESVFNISETLGLVGCSSSVIQSRRRFTVIIDRA